MTTPPHPGSRPWRGGTGSDDRTRALTLAGQRAAAWVRELADRQDNPVQRGVLTRVAAALGRVDGDGRAVGGGEAAAALLVAATVGRLPVLETGERAALVAVCALAAGVSRSDAADVAASMERAVAAGRTAGPGGGEDTPG